MRRARWLTLVAVTGVAIGCGGGGTRSAGEASEIEELRKEVQELRELLASDTTTGKKVKRYFDSKDADAKTTVSMYSYVDSLALVVCQLKKLGNPNGNNYGICADPERQEKVAPPTYPPR